MREVERNPLVPFPSPKTPSSMSLSSPELTALPPLFLSLTGRPALSAAAHGREREQAVVVGRVRVSGPRVRRVGPVAVEL
jgi:hypothetical protein